MQPASSSVASETSPLPSNVEAVCPICRGALAVLRGTKRCVRCSFSFCEGCEGDRPSYSGVSDQASGGC
jgi:hypothetical protein